MLFKIGDIVIDTKNRKGLIVAWNTPECTPRWLDVESYEPIENGGLFHGLPAYKVVFEGEPCESIVLERLLTLTFELK